MQFRYHPATKRIFQSLLDLQIATGSVQHHSNTSAVYHLISRRKLTSSNCTHDSVVDFLLINPVGILLIHDDGCRCAQTTDCGDITMFRQHRMAGILEPMLLNVHGITLFTDLDRDTGKRDVIRMDLHIFSS